MSAEKANELGLKTIARIKAVGYGGCHPSVMGLSPVPAVAQLLRKTGYSMGDFELIEFNEAFAAQYLGCDRELGLDREITNVNGSGGILTGLSLRAIAVLDPAELDVSTPIVYGSGGLVVDGVVGSCVHKPSVYDLNAVLMP